MSRIATFYSYKGGVGRTFALANIAVLLAQRGKRILMIDWDLEAPGLHRYFDSHLPTKLEPRRGLIHLLHESADSPDADWHAHCIEVEIEQGLTLSLIPSGDRDEQYASLVRSFSWSTYFGERNGAAVLERWSSEWKDRYDFVLVDSRTGITDAGGVCTILLPDILVLVFAANQQSFERGRQVALHAQRHRGQLAVRRTPLAVLPLLGRFDGREEVDEAQRWLDRLAVELKPFYDDWLPAHFQPRQILELTKIPYIAKFSFGEPLPVLSQGIRDPDGPGFYLDKIAELLATDLGSAQQILAPRRERVSDPEVVLSVAERVDALMAAGNFDEARELVSSLPSELNHVRKKLLGQIAGHEQVAHEISATIEEAQAFVNSGDFRKARGVVSRLSDEPSNLAELRERLLGQVDDAERSAELSRQVQAAIEKSQHHFTEGRYRQARDILQGIPDDSRDLIELKKRLLRQLDDAEEGLVKAMLERVTEALPARGDESLLRFELQESLKAGLTPEEALDALAARISENPQKYLRFGY